MKLAFKIVAIIFTSISIILFALAITKKLEKFTKLFEISAFVTMAIGMTFAIIEEYILK